MRTQPRTLGLLVLVTLMVIACQEPMDASESDDLQPDAVPVVPLASLTTQTAQAAPRDAERAPLTANDLHPVIRTVGAEGAIPREVVVQFGARVITPDVVGSITEGTVLSLEPEAPGRLLFTSESTLTFQPTQPLLPETRYRVRMESVGTRDGRIEAPHSVAWLYEFRTPAFAAREFAVRLVDLEENRAELELSFTGPVRVAELQKRALIKLDGTKPQSVAWAGTDRPEVVRVTISDADIKHGSTVRLELAAGLELAGHEDVRIGARTWDADVRAKDLVTIVALRRKEGPSGYFVEVVCDDSSAEGYRSWWYDDLTSDWLRLSPRCIPDEESAMAAIRVEPEIALSVSPTQHGFRVLGDFERGSYTVTIGAGLETDDGGRLEGTFSTGITVPARSPQVAFEAKGRYLPKDSWRRLGVRHLNVEEVAVQVRHIRPENLVFWLSGDDEAVDQRTSDRIVDTTVAVRGGPDAFATSWIDVGRLVPRAGNGVYEVTVSSEAKSDVSRLLVTDMNLVVKRGTGEKIGVGTDQEREKPAPVWAWAVGMHDNRPLAGVELDLVRRSGKVLASCTTRRDGGCELNPPDDPVDTSSPFAVLARKGDDLTYLRFADLEIEWSDSAVHGEPYQVEQPYRLAAWSDRDVYRPGDVAHLAGVLRDRRDRAPKQEIPIELAVNDPHGNTLYRHTLQTNAAGLVERDVTFADFAATGRWSAIFTVAEKVVARYDFHVEEFVPERMKVTATPPESDLLAGEPIPVEIEAQYLFGGSASGSAVELSCELKPEPFSPARNANFHYGPWHGEDGPPRPLPLGVASGEIDSDGIAKLSCPGLAGGVGFDGGGRIVASASVFEAGSGRSTRGSTSARLHPDRFHVGLDSGEDKVQANQPFTVSGVVVDWDGNETAVVDQVEVRLYRLVEEYGLTFDRSTHSERWRRYLRKVADGDLEIAVKDGKFTVPVTPTADSAGYLVRVKAGDAVTDLKLDGAGRRYWWWGDQDTVDETPRPLKPGSLEMELPEAVIVGREATVSFIAPYAGRALLTVETDEVIETAWLDVAEAGPVSWTFTPRKFVPNLYVGALLLKDPHLDSPDAFLPGRSFATASVTVEPTRFVREVTIDVPEEITPNSTLTVGVDGGSHGPAWATVAAVDVGILSLTGFDSPNPIDDLFTRRALGVDSFETVGWTLLTPPQGTSSAMGGDGGPAGMGRIQMVKPVALWSGLVELDGDGRGVVELDVPQYRGALRVMAVVVGAERVGSADAEVIVRDPLVLQATTPRFLVGGDRFELPVFVTNTTKEPRDVRVAMDVAEIDVGGMAPSGPVAPPVAVDAASQTVTLAPGESGTLLFRGEAIREVGAARFKVSARSGELESWDELEVPLMPAGQRERIVHRIDLSEGTTDLGPLLAGWVPTTEQTTFWVTTNPFGEVFDHLKWLIRYPYGCIEQTTSTTRPLLYVSRLIDHVDPSVAKDGGVEAMVDHGIRRVLSMQTASGGLSYWPGGTWPVAWGTAYGLHLLMDAKEAGYDVPEDSVDRALDWLGQAIDGGGDHLYAEAYAHYVLARAGRGRSARIEQMLGEFPTSGNSGESAEQVYMLQAALYLSGDRRYEDALRHPDLSTLTDHRENSWRWYSDRRRRAFMLNVMVDLFGRDDDTVALANVVAEGLRGHHSGWYTTQEISWGVAGLGKWLAGGADDFSPPELLLAGRSVPPSVSPGDSPERSWSIYRASEYETPELKLERKGSGDLFLLVSSSGIRTKSVPRIGGDGLKIARSWVRADGTPLEVTRKGSKAEGGVTPELGDLLYSVVHLTNTTGERVSNVALVDRFAAGWEVENPRLGRDHTPDFLQTGAEWSIDHMNLRDDRMEVFGALGPGETVTFAYALRAVTAGEYTVPPVEAEAMYDPRIWARSQAGTARVLGPWDAMSEEGE
jgi:alpha-2-macroglobulin